MPVIRRAVLTVSGAVSRPSRAPSSRPAHRFRRLLDRGLRQLDCVKLTGFGVKRVMRIVDLTTVKLTICCVVKLTVMRRQVDLPAEVFTTQLAVSLSCPAAARARAVARTIIVHLRCPSPI